MNMLIKYYLPSCDGVISDVVDDDDDEIWIPNQFLFDIVGQVEKNGIFFHHMKIFIFTFSLDDLVYIYFFSFEQQKRKKTALQCNEQMKWNSMWSNFK